ncbi:MAG: MmcQ/YjbR family DNA-binding protein [Ruthenibacterium sp.]
MTRAEVTDYCLAFPDAAEDYPFGDKSSTILRHKSNRKWFALVFEQDGRLCVNLKCEPMEADFLRRVYKAVLPAWHMNKTHWNTVVLNSDVPTEELFAMIDRSFDLTKTGAGQKKRAHKTSF